MLRFRLDVYNMFFCPALKALKGRNIIAQVVRPGFGNTPLYSGLTGRYIARRINISSNIPYVVPTLQAGD